MQAKVLILIFWLSGFFFNSQLTAQTKVNPFEGIALDNTLPEIFRAGEIYTLKGELVNFTNDVQLSADLYIVEGKQDYHKITSATSQNGRFSIQLDLRFPGFYNLSLNCNYKLMGTCLLKVIDPIAIISKPLQPITDFNSSVQNFQSRLTWQTENELVQLQLIQHDVEKTFTLSNKPDEFIFDPVEQSAFKPGEAIIRIRGARATDGSWLTMTSDWGDWLEMKRQLTENIAPVIHALAKFNEPYVPSGDKGSVLKLNLMIRTTYCPDAFIKTPDGRVDIIRLKSNKKLSEFSIGKETKELFPEGDCRLEYFPQLIGTYLVEINDDYGKALVNVPFYCGNLLPVLLPKAFVAFEQIENFDLEAERNKMLAQINSIRQKLGLHLLTLDSTLTALSQYYSDRMAAENFCEHVAPKDGEVLDRRRRKFGIVAMVSENVGKAPNVDQALYNLMQSPGHYAAMIDGSMTLAGIGISIDYTNHFLVAQHFSSAPFPPERLRDFLSGVFEKMKTVKNDLIRLDSPPGQDPITIATYQEQSIGRLEQLLLSERGQKIWGHESVGQVYFASFVQTIDGFKLEIQYYATPVQK